MDFFGAIIAILFFVVFVVIYHVLNQALAEKVGEWLQGRKQRISSKRKEG
jgi:F0F1-type ATP synthase membrane subunit b/b'